MTREQMIEKLTKAREIAGWIDPTFAFSLERKREMLSELDAVLAALPTSAPAVPVEECTCEAHPVDPACPKHGWAPVVPVDYAAGYFTSAPAVPVEREAHGYLSRLLVHYAPQCEPLPDLMGLCSQIDNLLVGLAAPPAVSAPPVTPEMPTVLIGDRVAYGEYPLTTVLGPLTAEAHNRHGWNVTAIERNGVVIWRKAEAP